MRSDQVAHHHNALAPTLVVQIATHGQTPQDVMVLLETIVAGVVTYVAASSSGGLTPHQLFDLMAGAMPQRLDDLASKVLKPEGQA